MPIHPSNNHIYYYPSIHHPSNHHSSIHQFIHPCINSSIYARCSYQWGFEGQLILCCQQSDSSRHFADAFPYSSPAKSKAPGAAGSQPLTAPPQHTHTHTHTHTTYAPATMRIAKAQGVMPLSHSPSTYIALAHWFAVVVESSVRILVALMVLNILK